MLLLFFCAVRSYIDKLKVETIGFTNLFFILIEPAIAREKHRRFPRESTPLQSINSYSFQIIYFGMVSLTKETDRSRTVQVAEDDQDNLWRCFSLYCLQGSAMESLQLRSHSFIKLIRDSKIPKRYGIDDLSATLVYRRYATGLPRHKSTNTRLLNSQKRSKTSPTKLGHYMTYNDFVHALVDIGCRVYSSENIRKEVALSRLVFRYVLPNAYQEHTRLPYSLSVTDFYELMSYPKVVNFMDEWDEILLDIFNRCRPTTSPKMSGEQRWMRYKEYQEFCENYLWFHTHRTRSVLSKYQIAQIFVAVKHGGGAGDMPDYISYSEFRTALVLLAYAGAESERMSHPVAYIGRDSQSSVAKSYSEIHKATIQHKAFDPVPVSKVKWLLSRIFECSEAKDNKTQWMNSFKDAYKSMYNRDGKPKSYLSPAYEEARLIKIRKRTGPQRAKEVIVKSPRRMSVGSGCEWIELRTAEGKPYYFHKGSSTVQWEKPTDDLVRIQADFENVNRSPTSPKLTKARRESMKF